MDSDEAINAFQQRLEAQHTVIPDDTYWGYFSYDESGAGMFLWFKTRNEMFDFMTDESAFLMGIDDSDALARHADVAAYLARLKTEDIPDHIAITKVNALLQHAMSIQWWGTFRDLTEANGEFPRHVIDDFEDSFDTTLQRPLTELQRQEWLAFLAEYGL